MSRDEWLAEGKRRFGDDWHNWKFVCPVCGHVQTPGEFETLGVDPQRAYAECLGRLLPRGEQAYDLATKPSDTGHSSPCDYCAFGLFHSGNIVIADWKHVHVFPFAEALETALPPQADKA
jgi:hypothetical protein